LGFADFARALPFFGWKNAQMDAIWTGNNALITKICRIRRIVYYNGVWKVAKFKRSSGK
jgi:hypothetical protein